MQDRSFYVYAHRDPQGSIFYIGKGKGDRAWSKSRHPTWQRYVTERLGGEYSVEVLQKDLEELDAEILEARLIREYGDQLVNWENPRRRFDYNAITRYHALRDANRQFVEATKALEKTDPALCAERYREALERMREYERLELERGLIAELRAGTKVGDVTILDRLTLVLVRLGRGAEAAREAEAYFSEFPAARRQALAKAIQRRVAKHADGSRVRPDA